MITIVRGNEKIVCSAKTYEEQFKQLGYLPISEMASTTKKEAAPKVASSLKGKEVREDEDSEKEKISEKYGLKSKKSTTTKKEDK